MAVDIGVLRGLLTLDDQLSTKLDLAGQKITAAGKKWERVGGQLTGIGSQLNRSVTLPLAAAAGGALTLSAQFETSLTKIETLVGIAGDEVEEFRDRVLELSGETAKAPKELADALFVVTSAGARGSTALEVLEKAAKASAAGLGDTTEIARAVTSAIAAYGEENLDASRATDILVATVREGNLEAGDLAGSLGRVIGIASQVGVSFEQVGGFVATFTRLGVNAEEAVTALRGVLSSSIAPTEGAAKALLEMGTSAAELRAKIKDDGLDAALMDLVQRADGNAEALAAVIPNVRALSGVLGTAGAQAETFGQINENIANSVGILGEAFDRTTETTGFKFQQFLAKLKTTGIELGDQLAPSLEKVLAGLVKLLGGISKLIEGFTKLPDFVQNTILVLFGLAAAAGPVLTIFGNLALIIGKVAVLLGGQMVASTTAAAAGTTTLTGSVAALGTAFMSLSIWILGPAGIVAALAIFAVKLANAKADIEEANFAFAEATGKMQGLADAARGVEDAFREGGAAGLNAYLETLDPAVVKSQEFAAQVGQLQAAGRLTGEEFAIVADTVHGFRGAIEETAEPLVVAQTNLTTTTTKTVELDEALQALGFTTVANVSTELENFSAVLEAGVVPAEQMVAKLDEMILSYTDLGLLTPEVTTQIQDQILKLAEQGATLTDGQIAMLEYADAMRIAGEQAAEAAAKQEELTQSVESFMSRTAGAMDQYTQGILDAQGATGEFVTALSSSGPPASGGFFGSIASMFSGLTGTATQAGTDSGGGFFSGLTSALGGLFGGGGGGGGGGFFSSMLSGIGGLFGQGGTEAGGGFLSSIGSMLGGAGGGAEGGLRGIFANALNLVPIVGPILSQFAGPLFDGLKAIGGKIIGWVKGLFGPSEQELKAREIANSMNQTFIDMLDHQQQLESGGELWAQQNIAIRDSFLAIGKSEAEAAAAAAGLQEAMRQGPEAAQAAIDGLKVVTDEVSAAMDSTGLTLLELRNKVHNTAQKMGITTAEAFDVVVEGIKATTEAGADATAEALETVTEAAASTASATEETFATAAESVSTSVGTIPEATAEAKTKTEAELAAIAAAAQKSATEVEGSFTTATMNVTSSLESISPTVNEATEKTAEELLELERQAVASAKGIEDSFGQISIRIPIDFDVNNPDMDLLGGGGGGDRDRNDRDREKFAIGTGTGGAFKQFGGGTRAVLHGEEAVITKGQGASLAMMIERAIGRGGDGGAGGTQHITLVADGQKLAEVVLRNQPRVLGNKGLRRG
jgi:TP901 family phage tail tape measure protein